MLWLSCNSPWWTGWPWTHRDPMASVFWDQKPLPWLTEKRIFLVCRQAAVTMAIFCLHVCWIQSPWDRAFIFWISEVTFLLFLWCLASLWYSSKPEDRLSLQWMWWNHGRVSQRAACWSHSLSHRVQDSLLSGNLIGEHVAPPPRCLLWDTLLPVIIPESGCFRLSAFIVYQLCGQTQTDHKDLQMLNTAQRSTNVEHCMYLGLGVHGCPHHAGRRELLVGSIVSPSSTSNRGIQTLGRVFTFPVMAGLDLLLLTKPSSHIKRHS